MDTKKKVKFTYIDGIIILLVILVLSTVWIYMTSRTYMDNYNITYTIRMENVRKEVADQINSNSNIFDSNKNYKIGEIVNVEKQQSVMQSLDSIDGKYIEAKVPNRYDILLTIKDKGHVSDEKIAIGDYELFVGKTVNLKGVNFVGTGTLWEILEVNENE